MTTKTRATIEDLYHVEGKAEIVNGEIVYMSPTGEGPIYAAGEIFASLRQHAKLTRHGRAVTDGAGFQVDLPNRESFSPDAAFLVSPRRNQRERMRFFKGAPAFAAEVRSEGDYGPAAELALAEKRADYFAAGTGVVWDVDLLSDDVVKVYRSTAPDQPTVYGRGQSAEAESAVPGWTMAVDELFEPE